jgi:pyruvate/2-oxoglutarate dehydrogenase complex dihydrolipoamide acyltransferase (E2) component
MSETLTMPALGESVDEATVTRWLKRPGERVEVDEPIAEVSTDKVDTEIVSPYAGVVERILVDEDETVPVGTALAIIGAGLALADLPAPTGEPVFAPAPAAPAAPEPEPVMEPEPELELEPKQDSDDVAVPAASAPYRTFLVRGLAREHGIDLDTVAGTGPGGRIRKSDLAPWLRAAPAAASGGMQLVSFVEVDVTRIVEGGASVVSAVAAAGIAGLDPAIVDSGARGVSWESAIVPEGRSAVLTIGAVQWRPVALESEGERAIAVRAVATIGLSYLATELDATDAARYLATLRETLATPAE